MEHAARKQPHIGRFGDSLTLPANVYVVATWREATPAGRECGGKWGAEAVYYVSRLLILFFFGRGWRVLDC